MAGCDGGGRGRVPMPSLAALLTEDTGRRPVSRPVDATAVRPAPVDAPRGNAAASASCRRRPRRVSNAGSAAIVGGAPQPNEFRTRPCVHARGESEHVPGAATYGAGDGERVVRAEPLESPPPRVDAAALPPRRPVARASAAPPRPSNCPCCCCCTSRSSCSNSASESDAALSPCAHAGSDASSASENCRRSSASVCPSAAHIAPSSSSSSSVYSSSSSCGQCPLNLPNLANCAVHSRRLP